MCIRDSSQNSGYSLPGGIIEFPTIATHFFVAWSVCLFSFIFVHPEDFQAVLKVPTSKGRGKEWERLGKKGDGVEGRQSRREREEESPMFSVLL